MKRSFTTAVFPICVGLAFFSAPGCPSGVEGPDAGELDAAVEYFSYDPTVTGTARVHPSALALLEDAGRPAPSFEGLLLRLEEPLQAALKDPLAVFGELSLDGGGKFRVEAVPSAQLNVGLAATISQATDGGTVVPASTILFDLRLEDGRPRHDLVDVVAYVLPVELHTALTQAVTPAVVHQLTSGKATSLLEAGFILGRVVDETGAPVAGARIAPEPGNLASRFLYPNQELTGTQVSTSDNGLFVFVHDATGALTFEYGVEGRAEYLKRSAVAAVGRAWMVSVYPGAAAFQ